uniref:Uncharacterized protein n=1 Tax=Gadus morhua TaxID=8049 RepID=A0A8C5CCX3_GADMO
MNHLDPIQRPKGQSSKVQNGAVTQKDSLNDDEFEPYLNTQARQVRILVTNKADCYSAITIVNWPTFK